MNLELLKQNIEDKKIEVGFLIFRYSDNDFLPLQYVDAISKVVGKNIEYIDDLSIILNNSNDLFFNEYTDTTLRVHRVRSLVISNEKLLKQRDLIIVCQSVEKDCETIYSNNIVDFPKLEEWQIKDYTYSLAEGISNNNLDYLISLCNNNIYRLDNELSKIKMFSKNERKYVFDDFINDGIFSDLSFYSVFNLTNALMKRDVNAVANIYKEIEKFDCEPLGLVTLLYQNLRNVITIQLSPNPTPESTGLPAKRFWAIKYMCGFYTRDQLMKMFELVTSIDKKLKTGYITVDIIIDYLICSILSV